MNQVFEKCQCLRIKSVLIGGSYLIVAILQVGLGAIYNLSVQWIFDGLSLKESPLFYQGVTSYVFVALSTAMCLSLSQYLRGLFCLVALKDWQHTKYYNNRATLKQFGDRVADDLYSFFYDGIFIFAQFISHLLKFFYFGIFCVVVMSQNSSCFERQIVFYILIISMFFCSWALFHNGSRELRHKKIIFEQNKVSWRTRLNENVDATDRLNRAFYSGKIMLKYEFKNQFFCEILNYSSYFIPLVIFAPIVLNGQITLGFYMRLAGAISHIGHSLNWFSHNLVSLSQWKVALARTRNLRSQ